MVFHMLRAELGDDNFTALLREFYKQHEGKTATIESFERMTATKVPAAEVRRTSAQSRFLLFTVAEFDRRPGIHASIHRLSHAEGL